jgi:hypothetical protein
MKVLAAVAAIALTSAQVVADTPPEHNALLELGHNVAISVCGDIPPTRIDESENIHEPGVTDRLEIRTCPIGESHILVSPAASDPIGLPLFVRVGGHHPLLPAYLQIGQPISSLTTFIGKPDYESDSTITYVLTESESTLSIETSLGNIISVTWHFYSG